MSVLFEKKRKHADYCVRCYLTLRCDSRCAFCSAQIPSVSDRRREVEIPAEIWADGLNRRGRHAILAGGEPFLYSQFAELIGLLEPRYKVEIYTNLQYDVTEFIGAARWPYSFLISLHPGTDLDAWRRRVQALSDDGHSLRFHIVRTPGYEKLADFLKSSGIVGRYRTALQGDQRAGPKSAGIAANAAHPLVDCTSRIFLFGPDGSRYHCVHKMIMGDANACFGHISRDDDDILTRMRCREFGLCSGCDNNIEGRVEDVA